MLALVSVGAGSGYAAAQDGGADEGGPPTITLDRAQFAPGERAMVTLAGWEGQAVTLMVCGNLAQRGSVDCNLASSQALVTNRDGSVTYTEFVVATPPTTCPCVIRVSSTGNASVATAEVELTGVAVGPIVEPDGVPRLTVSVKAKVAPQGLIRIARAALAGPTDYDVTVEVKNRSATAIDAVTLVGTAKGSIGGRTTQLTLPLIEKLEPGKSWVHTARATLPAPAMGSLTFSVTASDGITDPIDATQSTRRVPPVFVGLLLLLAADVGVLMSRRLRRLRERRTVKPRKERKGRVDGDRSPSGQIDVIAAQ